MRCMGTSMVTSVEIPICVMLVTMRCMGTIVEPDFLRNDLIEGVLNNSFRPHFL